MSEEKCSGCGAIIDHECSSDYVEWECRSYRHTYLQGTATMTAFVPSRVCLQIAELKAAVAHERRVANDVLRSWEVERKSNAKMEAALETAADNLQATAIELAAAEAALAAKEEK